MLLQVLVQVVHGAGDVSPQPLLDGHLVGVGVEAAVLGVEDAGTQAGQEHLGHPTQALGDGVGGVFHGGGVLLGRCPQDISPLEGVQAGLAQVIHHPPAAHGGRVHAGEGLQHLAPLLFRLNAGQQAVALQVAHRGHRRPLGRQGAGQPVAEVDGGDHVLAPGVQLTDGPSQPPLFSHPGRLSGMPDIHGAKVGAVGVGVADTVDDGHLALVPQLLNGAHARV